MSLDATYASEVDAALLHDGVADTLASGRRPAINRAAVPLEVRQLPCHPDRDEFGRQRELLRAPVLASLTWGSARRQLGATLRG